MQRTGLKNPWMFLIDPQNSLNGLIVNWGIGGCWFTPVGNWEAET
jgi:hypothetical protein